MSAEKVEGKKQSVIYITKEAREDYGRVQTIIGARTQPITLRAVMGWLTSDDPAAKDALHAIASYRAGLAQAEIASAV